MNIQRVVGIVTIIGLCFSNLAAAAEKGENPPAGAPANSLGVAIGGMYQSVEKRPALLPALYAAFGAMQAWDVYTTSAALKSGAHEANPVAAPFAGNAAHLIGLKAVTTASTIFFVERMWRHNRVGAVVLLTLVNGATAAVAMQNARNARIAH